MNKSTELVQQVKDIDVMNDFINENKVESCPAFCVVESVFNTDESKLKDFADQLQAEICVRGEGSKARLVAAFLDFIESRIPEKHDEILEDIRSQ